VEVEMSYAQSPPLAEDTWFTDPVPSDAPLRERNARPDRRLPEPLAEPELPPRAFGRKGSQDVANRPSFVRRFFRGLFRFLIAVSIGVGGTIAAQTDMAKEMLATQAPTLAWVLSVSPAKSLGMAAPAQLAEPSMSPVMSTLAPGLDAVRRSVEQLAVRQDQMAQAMAALQAAEEDIRQKITPPPQPREAIAVPPPKPVQPRTPLPAAASAPRPAPGAPLPLPSR
jgi:hypothetical protein